MPRVDHTTSECGTGDNIGSHRCDCGPQLDDALRQIASEGHGVFILVRGHEGRGLGLLMKNLIYQEMDAGTDTHPAAKEISGQTDTRSFRDAASLLQGLGVASIRLITNSKEKIDEMRGFGFKVIRVPSRPRFSSESVNG